MSTLFCHGISGEGKTVIAAITVDHLRENFRNFDVAVAYMYRNSKRRDIQTINGLTSRHRETVASGAPAIWRAHDYSTYTTPPWNSATTLRSIQCFKCCCRYIRKGFIIVDALDECTSSRTQSELLTKLRSFDNKTERKPVATLRFDSNPERVFEGSSKLETRASDTDLERFATNRVNRLADHVQRSNDLHVKVRKVLHK